MGVSDEAPRKPQWFKPLSPLPHPRNLPAPSVAGATESMRLAPSVTPTPNARPVGAWVVKLPWPPVRGLWDGRTPTLRLAQYRDECERAIGGAMREHSGLVCVDYDLSPPIMADPSHRFMAFGEYVRPVRWALRQLAVWTDESKLRGESWSMLPSSSEGFVVVSVAQG